MACLPKNPAAIRAYLSENGFIDPVFETRLIVAEITEVEFAKSDACSYQPFNVIEIQKLADLWPAIQEKMPIQYRIGYTFACGTKIRLSENTMCPSPQIELTISKAYQIMSERPPGVVIDLCTGSGAIAIVLAKAFPKWMIYGVDISSKALEIAWRNCDQYNLSNLCFVEGDLFNAVALHKLKGNVDLVVAAPPYCATKDIQSERIQIRDYSPRIAIDGGQDGLFFFRRILEDAAGFMTVEGKIIFEHGRDQHEKIKLLNLHSFRIEEALFHKGRKRVLVLGMPFSLQG